MRRNPVALILAFVLLVPVTFAAGYKYPKTAAGAVADDIVDQFRVQPGLHSENEGLFGRYVFNCDQQVSDELHFSAVTEFADVVITAGEALLDGYAAV